MAGEWLAYGELGLAVAGFAPFALHRWSCGRWMKQQLVCPEEMSGLDMTILLPVWNEGLIIENKLSNLAKQDFKSKLLHGFSTLANKTFFIIWYIETICVHLILIGVKNK